MNKSELSCFINAISTKNVGPTFWVIFLTFNLLQKHHKKGQKWPNKSDISLQQ